MKRYKQQLRAMIKKQGLHDITLEITNICIEKANYWRDTWKDSFARDIWHKAAHHIDHASAEISKLKLP